MSCSLTLSDCDLILRQHLHDDIGKTTSIGFKVKPISDNITGYMGKHLTIEIEYKFNDEDARINKARFFLKSTTDLSNPYVNFFPKVHYKETGMYQMMRKYDADCGDLFKLDVAPKMYLDHAISETIVMEDLSIRGFRMYDVKKIVDASHMLVALHTLAKLHAASIIYEETKTTQLERKFDITEEFGYYLEETAFSRHYENPYKYTMAGLRGLCALTDLMPPDNRISPDEFKRQIMIAGWKMLDLMEDTKTYRCVWSHGDLWARNIMYSYDKENNNPTDCKFVDFQFVRYAPPALDVTLLIYHTLNVETYENNYDRFLDHYYESFMKHLEQAGVKGDQIYAKEYFLKSCQDYLYCSKLMLGL